MTYKKIFVNLFMVNALQIQIRPIENKSDALTLNKRPPDVFEGLFRSHSGRIGYATILLKAKNNFSLVKEAFKKTVY